MLSYYIVPDDILLQAGSEEVNINRQTMLKTTKGYISLSEKDVPQKHKWNVMLRSVYNRNAIKKVFVRNCEVKRTKIQMTIDTKARTPFFLSGPEFSFVFDRSTKTTQSWVDVMVTAVRSEQKSVTSENCLGYYNVHKSIYKKGNLFS